MTTHCSEPPPAATRVLVVDDEPLVRWAVAETLADSGFHVLEAGDAKGALGFVRGAHTDAVLLDLRLPDCDDLGVLSAIRQLSPKTPVILMTAYGSPEVLDEARRLGAFAVVDKPFELNELAPLIQKALVATPLQ